MAEENNVRYVEILFEFTFSYFYGFSTVVAITCIGAILGWFLGDINGFIYALLTFCIMVYITGVMAAYIKAELSSSIGFNGILRKISIFILVGMTHVIDHELLGDKVPLRDAVIFFYLANEGLSLIENAVVIGLPVPEILKSKLLEFRKKSED